jgi:putative two-component system response regulator
MADRNTVLVVDDEETIRDYLKEVLDIEGYDCRVFPDSLAALDYLTRSEGPAHLMLADINMPAMNGIELLRNVKEIKPEMPVILVSGLYELALALDALESGAADYLRKPVLPNDVAAAVRKYLRADLAENEKEILKLLEEFLQGGGSDPKASAHIRKVFRNLGFKRYETFQHSKRVAAYSRLLGEACGLNRRQLDELELGAMLHDIGKVGIPRNILLKPGPLNPEEREVINAHPAIGAELLARLDGLRPEAEIVLGHHERFDGTGYPSGLKGPEIPLLARIFSICDAWDAMTSDRPYREPRSTEQARQEVARGGGSHFDPAITSAFLGLDAADLEAIQRRYPDIRGDEPLAEAH